MASDLGIDAAIHGHPDGQRARAQEGLFWRAITQLQEVVPGLVVGGFDVKGCKGATPLKEMVPKYAEAMASALIKIMKSAEAKIGKNVRFSLHFGNHFIVP